MKNKEAIKSKVSCKCGLCGREFGVDREALTSDGGDVATSLSQEYTKSDKSKIKINVCVQAVDKDICERCSKAVALRFAAEQAEELGFKDMSLIFKNYLVRLLG